MEIVTSRISVYEIELDLQYWTLKDSSEVPGLSDKISLVIPSLSRHLCMSGQEGGFLDEVAAGTNMAHVIEHIIIELIHLSDKDKQLYSGWTRKTGDNSYVIHYSAPGFLVARLSAILAVDLLKNILKDKPVNLDEYITPLKQPFKFFTRDGLIKLPVSGISEPVSVFPEMAATEQTAALSEPRLLLTPAQRENIIKMYQQIKRHNGFIRDSWKNSFLRYSGLFGEEIIGKLELLNIDNFKELLLNDKFDNLFEGVKNLSQLVCSYHIPMHFVIRSVWIYKNKLMSFIIEDYEDDKRGLRQCISDLDDLYKIIFQNVMDGYNCHIAGKQEISVDELKRFKEFKLPRGVILIIDDDEMMRKASRDILEYNGFQVIEAKDGMEALKIFINNDIEISLIILDIVLPEMDGIEVYKEIKNLRPNSRVLFMSGYPIDNAMQQYLNNESLSYIQKPFKVKSFLETVQNMLHI